MARMKYSAMSVGVMVSAIKALKLKAPAQKNPPALAAVLKAHFKAQAANDPKKADDLSECSNCGGDSDISLEVCPYCGDSEINNGEGADQTITTTAEPAPAIDTEELDNAVAAFKQKKRNAEASIWELGVEVARIHDGDLWKTRLLGPNPQYKTFKAFCGAELGISHTHAYSLIEVAKKFTREQVEQLGVSKLAIIVQLPPDKQAAALNGAADKSKRDLAAELAESKGKTPKPDAVTIMTRAGGHVKLTMQGTNTKGKPATELADEPWVEEEHENGVISRYAIKVEPKTGHIRLIITRRRA